MTNIEAKERILNAVKAKYQVTFRGKPIRITPDFPNQVRKARRAWSNIFQTMNDNNLQPKISYPAKLSLRVDGEIETFHNKQKLKEFMSTKPALEKILKEINHKEEINNNHQSQKINRQHQSTN